MTLVEEIIKRYGDDVVLEANDFVCLSINSDNENSLHAIIEDSGIDYEGCCGDKLVYVSNDLVQDINSYKQLLELIVTLKCFPKDGAICYTKSSNDEWCLRVDNLPYRQNSFKENEAEYLIERIHRARLLTTKPLTIDNTIATPTAIAFGKQTTTTSKEIVMENKTIKSTTKDLLEINKAAAYTVARITTGKALTTKLAKVIKPKLPMMVRGYADHPLFKSVLANLIGLAIKRYTNNNRANQAADMMIEASMFQLAESFNIQEIIDSFLDGFQLPGEEEAKPKKVVKGHTKDKHTDKE